MTEISEWYTNEGLGRSLSLLLFIRNVAHSKHWGCFWAPGTLDSILYQTPSSFGPVRERHASKCQWWHGFKNPVCSCLHDWQRLMTLLSASEPSSPPAYSTDVPVRDKANRDVLFYWDLLRECVFCVVGLRLILSLLLHESVYCGVDTADLHDVFY